MRRTFLLAFLVAALPAAGSTGCAPDSCLPPPDWPDEVDFGPRLPDRHAEYQRFSVDSAGRILWSGFPGRPTAVGRAELAEILAAAAGGPEEPWLVLDAPPDADCETVRFVRAEMDRLPLCRRGRCVDGKAWDRADPPRGL